MIVKDDGIMLNLPINFGVRCLVCLAAVVLGLPAARFGGGESDLGTVDALEAIVGTYRLASTNRYPGVDRKKDVEEVTPLTSLLRRPKLAEGFFGAHNPRRPGGKKKKPGHDRATCNYTRATDGGETNRKTNDDLLVSTNMLTVSTITASPGRIVFNNENECVLASSGRPCVCYMTDFLDLLSRILDDTTADGQVATTSQCPSYKAVPAAFVVSPAAVALATVITTVNVFQPKITVNKSSGDENEDINDVVRKEVDFDYVVDYHLQTPKDDFKAIHYGLVGSDVRIRCLVKNEFNSTGINAFRWDYKKGKHKTNSTITGMDTSNLLILGLEPGDSKNYTCIPYTGAIRNSKYSTSYTHYVVAVDKPIYEIHGTAIYKTNSGGGCTPEIINNVQKQLPSSIQSELCPEGLSRYACNVSVETSKCIENERTLVIDYLVTLNDKANYLARIKTSKKGQNALCYQQILARVSKVLAANLYKILTIQIMSKMSLIYTHFESNYGQIKIKKYVSCSPGFGIQEVFCGACPPHHYSPDKLTECLKCRKGFHQPVAGSEKCVKCPNLFASGCYMRDISPYVYYLTPFICCSVCIILFVACLCCCREENETNIRTIPKKIWRQFKKTKKKSYDVLSSGQTSENTETEDSKINEDHLCKSCRCRTPEISKDITPKSSKDSTHKRRYKKLVKSKSKIIRSEIPFNSVHEKFGRCILQDELISK